MIKNISLILFALLIIASPDCFAKSELSQAAQTTQANQSTQTTSVANDKTKSNIDPQKEAELLKEIGMDTKENTAVSKPEDFNFGDNSFAITDEQFEEAKKISEQLDGKQSLDERIINSSHFSVGTPSKTYAPVNK